MECDGRELSLKVALTEQPEDTNEDPSSESKTEVSSA